MISQKSYKDFELLRQVTQNPITKKAVHASRHQSDFFSLLLTLILGLPVGGEGGRRAGIVECTLEASIQGRAPPLSSDPSLLGTQPGPDPGHLWGSGALSVQEGQQCLWGLRARTWTWTQEDRGSHLSTVFSTFLPTFLCSSGQHWACGEGFYIPGEDVILISSLRPKR